MLRLPVRAPAASTPPTLTRSTATLADESGLIVASTPEASTPLKVAPFDATEPARALATLTLVLPSPPRAKRTPEASTPPTRAPCATTAEADAA